MNKADSVKKKTSTFKVSSKHQPRGFRIVHDDLDIIVGVKAADLLTVAAKWERKHTVHELLNEYVRKGNSRSSKCVYVVHRLDQATTGLLVFAKSESSQQFLKNNWSTFKKTYYTIVHGHLKNKKGQCKSYFKEDENYHVHSSATNNGGELAITEYEVIEESAQYSLVKIQLVTGKKNQIRVHLAELGNPVVGDTKYGRPKSNFKNLMLHAYQLELTHPFSKERLTFTANPPAHFQALFKVST